jgi:hypothetical protein
MKTILAFLKGMREFRRDVTTHYADWALMDAYDRGREWAHRVTLRRFEVA